jgi:ERCC4-type nuclease
MSSKDKDGNQRNLCPLTTDKQKRETANKQVATIKEAFPPGVAQPALRALASAGYTSLDQLANVREEDLMALHGMGPKAMGILRGALQAKGKSFRS